MSGTRSTRTRSSDLMEMETGGDFSGGFSKGPSLFAAHGGEAHHHHHHTNGLPDDIACAPQPPQAQAESALNENTAAVLQHKYRSWSRHLTLYSVLGNIGMLLTVVSNNETGVLSRVFCIGTYGHVFMEGSLLIRLLFPPSRNYQLQTLHNYWGVVTVLALLLYGNSYGELLWAAESILTDSMSLILGAWLIQADVAPQVKLIGLSHFIHGVTFEFFLWFDIAALSATYSSSRGVFWVILVVANAVSQVVFHGPVIRGDFASSDKPHTPPPQARRNLVWLWLVHNIISVPLVLIFSTLGENHFYLEETRILPIYQVMIYTVPLPGLMIILYFFLQSKHAPFVTLGQENSVENINRPVPYELMQDATLPTKRHHHHSYHPNDVEALSALGEVFSGVSGTMVHAAFQMLLGTVR
jgi:hypothetical protein